VTAINEDGLCPNEGSALRHLMKTAQQAAPNEVKSPTKIISSEGATSLAKRLHSFISPAGATSLKKP
jgi:hypothetical protein